MEVPVSIAIRLATIGVAKVDLTAQLVVQVHLIRVQICQHIGVLTSQCRNIVDGVSAIGVDRIFCAEITFPSSRLVGASYQELKARLPSSTAGASPINS